MTNAVGSDQRQKPEIDALLDAVVNRIAAKVCDQLADHGAAVIKPRLLTVEQAAIYLARTKEAVQHMIGSGKLRVVRPDRRVFLDVLDLDRWIDANKVDIQC
jgi:excisionase family DNA binding protein